MTQALIVIGAVARTIGPHDAEATRIKPCSFGPGRAVSVIAAISQSPEHKADMTPSGRPEPELGP